MMSLLMMIVEVYLLMAMLIVVVAVLVTLCIWQRRELRRVKRALARFIVESIQNKHPDLYVTNDDRARPPTD
jgi:hypothetical protein